MPKKVRGLMLGKPTFAPYPCKGGSMGITTDFVITFVSPCLLPMIPIYVTYFAAGEEARTAVVLRNALGFVLGFTVVFIALGALASTVGAFFAAWTRLRHLALLHLQERGGEGPCAQHSEEYRPRHSPGSDPGFLERVGGVRLPRGRAGICWLPGATMNNWATFCSRVMALRRAAAASSTAAMLSGDRWRRPPRNWPPWTSCPSRPPSRPGCR